MTPTVPNLCSEDDECFFADIATSCAFKLGDKTIFVLCHPDHYTALKRRITITHYLSALEPCGGLFRVTLCGSDSKDLVIYMTAEGIHQAIYFAENSLETQRFYTVPC